MIIGPEIGFKRWRWLRLLLWPLIICCVLMLTSCATPQWRIGKKKIPQAPEVTKEQREAWAQGADYLKKTVEQPQEAVDVSRELSGSIGAPRQPLDDQSAVVEVLRAQYRLEQMRLDETREFLRRYQGKPVEGTGWNLFPAFKWTVIIGIVAACAVFPPLIKLIYSLWSGYRKSTSQIVQGVQEWVESEPERAKGLLSTLSRKTDSDTKRTVKLIKAEI